METSRLKIWKTYPVQDGGPAFHCDALEYGEHGKTNVIKWGDSIVRPLPTLMADWNIGITNIAAMRGIIIFVMRITRCCHLTFFHNLIWKYNTMLCTTNKTDFVLDMTQYFVLCETWGSHTTVGEDLVILGCDALPLGEWFLMFWRTVIPSSRVKQCNKASWSAWPLKMKAMQSFKT